MFQALKQEAMEYERDILLVYPFEISYYRFSPWFFMVVAIVIVAVVLVVLLAVAYKYFSQKVKIQNVADNITYYGVGR